MRGTPGKYVNSLLVFASSLSLYLLFLLVWMRGYRIPDEELYHSVGLAYVRGILSGDLNAFLVNIEHPPLAKIITGVFAVVLGSFGIGEYPIPTRVHFSVAVALISVFIFRIGEKIRGGRSGFVFWLFFLPVPAIASRDYYSVVDATSLFFLLLAFQSFLLESRYLRGGIFYGLASLSKFVPLPLFPVVVAFWSLYNRVGYREMIAQLKSICLGLAVFWLGEPLLWNPKLVSLLIERLALQKHSLAIWSIPFLHFVEEEKGTIFEIMTFLFYTISYPCERFLNANPYVLFVIAIYFLAVKCHKLSQFEEFLLLWVSVTHLIFAVNRVRMWYHDFWVMLPMMLFLASIVSRLFEKTLCRDIPGKPP